MKVNYLFSSPNGDIVLKPEDLSGPFLITPSEPHPPLTLRDYFEAIEAFILKDQAEPLISVLEEQLKKRAHLHDIREISIRSEKHGVLYHLASVEILMRSHRMKFMVSTAASEKGKEWLSHEYEILNFLNYNHNLSYLPKVYFKGELEQEVGDQAPETWISFLAEWLSGYHEWHFSIDETDKKQKACIWDLKNGYRYASQEEAFEIFKQASRILTLYYNTINFNQIYPWHHAAGDFVVRARDGNVEVKLTTARRYQSIMSFFSEDAVDPIIAIIYFFLNLTIRMRLDKLDGVGETVWAENFAVDAAIKGFFEALEIMEAGGRYHLGQVEDLHSLLLSFEKEELEKLFQSLSGFYRDNDPSDFALIQKNLKGHVHQLYMVFHGYHL